MAAVKVKIDKIIGKFYFRLNVTVTILHNIIKQWNKTFKLTLGPDAPINADFGPMKTTSITIVDYFSRKANALPTSPVVVSLLHYDNAKRHLNEPATPGYPLVCIAPCKRNHPEYNKVKKECKNQSKDKITELKYSWEIAPPTEGDETLTSFYPLTDSTIFANSSTFVLDSMYFSSHFRVRCVIQLVKNGEKIGTPVKSKPILISFSSHICNRDSGKGQQAFTAKLTYINSTSKIYPNTVHIGVKVPHTDGMIPILSTLPISELNLLLTETSFKTKHNCSNLVPSSAFLNQSINDDDNHIGSRPYQWDFNMREVI